MTFSELPITNYFARIPKRKAAPPKAKQPIPKRKRLSNPLPSDSGASTSKDVCGDTQAGTHPQPTIQIKKEGEVVNSKRKKGKTVAFAIDLTLDDDPVPPKKESASPMQSSVALGNDLELEETVPSSQSQYFPPSSTFQHLDPDEVPSSQSQYFSLSASPPPHYLPTKQTLDLLRSPSPPPSPAERDDGDVPTSQSQPPLSSYSTDYKDDIPSSQSQYQDQAIPISSLVDLNDVFDDDPLPTHDASNKLDESETESDDDIPVGRQEVAQKCDQDAVSQPSSLPKEIADFFDMIGDESYPQSFPQSLQATQ